MINIASNINSYNFNKYNMPNKREINNKKFQFNNTQNDNSFEIISKHNKTISKFKGFVGSFSEPRVYQAFNFKSCEADKFLSKSPNKTSSIKNITNDENRETINPGEEFYWTQNFDENNLFKSQTYKYSEKSTAENPILIAEINLRNGETYFLEIDINKIDPKNATAIEMQALSAHLVKKGNGEMDYFDYLNIIEKPYYPIDSSKDKDVMRHCFNFNLEHSNGVDRCDYTVLLNEKLQLFYKVRDRSLSSKTENILKAIANYPKTK